jgi:hypothetical protein
MESERAVLAEPEAAQTMHDAVEAPPIIVWGSPGSQVDGRGGMGGGSESAVGMVEPEMSMMAAPEEMPVEAPAPAPVEGEQEAMAKEAPALSTAADLAEPVEGTGPILGVAPVEEQGAMQLKNVPADMLMTEDEQQAALPVNPWSILQVGLVLIAIGSAAVALYLKRKANA